MVLADKKWNCRTCIKRYDTVARGPPHHLARPAGRIMKRDRKALLLKALAGPAERCGAVSLHARMEKMEVTVNVPDQLAAEARAHGVSVEVYVEEILARQALDVTGEERLQSARAAIKRIRELRKGN